MLPGAGQVGDRSPSSISIVAVIGSTTVVVVAGTVVVVLVVEVDVSAEVSSVGPVVASASGALLDAPDGEVMSAKVTATAIPPLKKALLKGI